MYESGLSKKAKILFLVIIFLVSFLLLKVSGCSALAQGPQEGMYELEQKGKVIDTFFLR